ncbi:MAG: CehA/McbA family metallohydrolase [Planctomycetaceae bacterium]|nr:CehA/McbA family metallohydrolase [Planctomycetaceae bacterium]
MLQKHVLAFALLLLLTLPRQLSAFAQESDLRAEQLTESNWDQLVPAGKEVDAIYGDFALRNQHIRAVIAQPLATRNANMTVRTIGGALIDLTARSFESDQLSAYYPSRRTVTFTDAKAEVSDQEARVTVSAAGSDTKPAITVVYSLTPDSRSIRVTSTWTNSTTSDLTLTLEDDLRADGGNEEMVKVPNGTHDLYWFHDVYWQQAYGIRADGYQLRCNSNSRESVIVFEGAEAAVLKPGQSFSLTRTIQPGRDLPEVLGQDDAERGVDLVPAALQVVDAFGQPVSGARVVVKSAGQNRGTFVQSDDQARVVAVPATPIEAAVFVEGTQYFEGAVELAPPGGDGVGTTQLPLKTYRPGTVAIRVTDGEQRAIPAKIEFRGNGETPTPDWGPQSADHLLKNLVYAPLGTWDVRLQQGTYDVIISHGPEYDAVFTKVSVDPGRTTELKAVLKRVVRTPGWVSADFHSHSTPSGDNTGSQLGRVLNLAAEHIEFAPCTEHNRISTYDPHLDSQGLRPFLATVSGMELTGSPLPLNHQNSFPLIHKPRTQDGGAPVTDGSPETQVERLAAWDNHSRKLIQQNHPDIGWLFYDKDGNEKPDEGYSRSFEHLDVMEIHPIDRILDRGRLDVRDGKVFGNNRMTNWLQLLNQGFRIYGVVNTDAHYNFHGSGGLRIWVQSSTDDPANIDPHEMMVASEEGRIIMSNGPYIEATVWEQDGGPKVVAGQDLEAKSHKVKAHVRVQSPNWIPLDTVFVLVNGRPVSELTFTREQSPDAFGSGTVRFDRTLEIELKEDSHLIFVTGHRSEQLGPVLGASWGSQNPAALTNPIFVDVDGNGFTANKDTLDFPLPVKYVDK